MSDKKFNKVIKEAFDEMDAHDLAQAMYTKEDIWNSLKVNKKQPRKFNGLLWFIMGLLLALGVLFLKEMIFEYENSGRQDTIIADTGKQNQWEAQLELMEKKIEEMGQKYEEKSALLDSLNIRNQYLQNELKMLASAGDNPITDVQIQYVKDTIYLTEIKEKQVEVKQVIKDTIYIEVPVMIEGDELMTDINSNLETIIDKKAKGTGSPRKKDNPRSIQFNFRKDNSDK